MIVICIKCKETMTLSDKGIKRMEAENEIIENSTFICDDCIEELDYIIEAKH